MAQPCCHLSRSRQLKAEHLVTAVGTWSVGTHRAGRT